MPSKNVLDEDRYSFEEGPFFLKNEIWERLRVQPGKSGSFHAPSSADPEQEKLRAESALIKKAEEIYREAVAKAGQLIDDARREARETSERLQAESERKATQFLEEAERQSEKVREDAYGRGYQEGAAKGEQEGLIKGQSKGMEEWQGSIDRWAQLCRQVHADQKDLMQKAESSLQELSIQIAEKIIVGSIPLDQAIVVRQVRESLREAVDREWLRVKVHPDDFQELIKARSSLISEMGQENIEIVDDAGIERGGCVIETPSGNIDARISTQLDKVRSALREG